VELTENVPSRLEGLRGTTFINGGEEYLAIYFLKIKCIRGPNFDSKVKDVKNVVYRPVAVKRRAIYLSSSQ